MDSTDDSRLDALPTWQLSELQLNRTWLASLIALGIISLAALLLFGDSHETLELMAEADWRLLLAAFLIHYSGFAIRGLRWKILLGSMEHRLPYLYCTGLLLSGWFVSAIIPARAGDILRVGILRSPAQNNAHIEPVPMTDSISSVVMERVLDMVAILMLGAGFGFLVLQNQLPKWVLALYGTIIVLLGVLALALLVLPRIWDLLAGLWQNSLWQRAVAFGHEMTNKLSILIRTPKSALSVVGLSLYIWLCDAWLLWLVMGSLGELTDFGPAAFVALTVDVIAAVPITPGGIMQIEGAYAALLGLMALPLVKLPAIILLTRAISYWSFLIFSGIVTLFFFGRLRIR